VQGLAFLAWQLVGCRRMGSTFMLAVNSGSRFLHYVFCNKLFHDYGVGLNDGGFYLIPPVE